MLLTDYYNLSPLERVQAAKEEALLQGQNPVQVYAFLEQACSHFDQGQLSDPEPPGPSTLQQINKAAISEAIMHTGSIKLAAKQLNISRTTVYRQMAAAGGKK